MSGQDLPTEDDFDPETDDFFLECQTKKRNYKHFDLPIADENLVRVWDFASETSRHRFLPLLGFTDVRRRVVFEGGAPRVKEKPRPIRFAGHQDSAYLEAYAEHLSAYYEATLAVDGTASNVLAYRRGGLTNIDHAKSLFDEIRLRRNCVVLALDISKFFDCLDHRRLRSELCGVLGTERLTGHHQTVFRALTRYSWVEIDDLDRLLGKKRVREGRVCSQADFVDHVRGRSRGLIRTHDLECGIPQGTPVSGLYANVYLRSFDRDMVTLLSRMGGSYRRYSDDIAIVLEAGAKVAHILGIAEKNLGDYCLALSEDKVETSSFSGPPLIADRAIQYLCFTFDGGQTKIRNSSMDAYRSKMRRGVRAKLVAAKRKGVASSKVFKREALSRYTHLGKRRNFLKYAYRAAKVLDAPEIRIQVKPHMTWFNRAWRREVEHVYGGLVE